MENIKVKKISKTQMAFDLIKNGKTDDEVIQLTGLKPASVRCYRNQYNKSIGQGKMSTRDKRVQKLLLSGLSIYDVAKALDYSIERVQEIIKTYDLKVVNASLVPFEDDLVEDTRTISGGRAKVFEMLEFGKTTNEIVKATGLKKSTIDTYRSEYNMERQRRDLEKVSELVLFAPEEVDTEVNEPNLAITPMSPVKMPAKKLMVKDVPVKNQEFFINNNKYDITYYVIDNLEWYDFTQIIDMFRSETGFDIMRSKYVLHERYLKNEVINKKQVNLIDKNILLDLVANTKDFKLIHCILGMYNLHSNSLYTASTILEGLKYLQDLPEQVEDLTEKIKLYNNIEIDLMHELSNKQYLENELLEEAKNMKQFIDERRNVKNNLSIATNIKTNLRWHKINTASLKSFQKQLEGVVHDFYLKKYNRRTGGAEGWQKEIVSKFLSM